MADDYRSFKYALGFAVPKKGKLRITFVVDEFSQRRERQGRMLRGVSEYYLKQVVQNENRSPPVVVDAEGLPTKWTVEIYPNGSDGTNGGPIAIYLLPDSVCDSLICTASGTLSAVGKVAEGLIFNGDIDSPPPISITVEELFQNKANLMPDDKLLLVFDGEVTITARPLGSPHGTMASADCAVHCIEYDDYTDEEVLVKAFRAHRVVVGSVSVHYKEKCDEPTAIIKIQSHPETVRHFLHLIYGGTLDGEELLAQAVPLLNLGSGEPIELLHNLCDGFLADRVTSAKDVCRYLPIACRTSASRLKEACFEYFHNHREEVTSSPEFNPSFLGHNIVKALIQQCNSDSSIKGLLESASGDKIADCKVQCVLSLEQSAGREGETTKEGNIILKSFPAHRFMLCSHSSVFDAMFTRGFYDENDGEVSIPDVEPDVMEVFLDSIYSRHIDDSTLDSFADDLIYASAKYDVKALKKRLDGRLRRNLRNENCAHTLVVANQYFDKDLKNACIEHICLNWEAIEPSFSLDSIGVDLAKELMSAFRHYRAGNAVVSDF